MNGRVRQASHSEGIDYAAWADFRYEIRLWLRISEEVAARFDLPPQQHQLLLAIKGFRGPESPMITDLAERMQLRHHSIVGLLDRMEQNGLVERHPTGEGRALAIVLTRDGEELLAAVSNELRPELQVAARRLIAELARLTPARSSSRVLSREPGRRTARSASSR